jgi:hypothetical protein
MLLGIAAGEAEPSFNVIETNFTRKSKVPAKEPSHQGRIQDLDRNGTGSPTVAEWAARRLELVSSKRGCLLRRCSSRSLFIVRWTENVSRRAIPSRGLSLGSFRTIAWNYAGLRGEGSTPVPLPPPACPRPGNLRLNSRAKKPSNSSDFSFELRTPNRQRPLIILRKVHFSPKLWTPQIRYGSRNPNVSSDL